MKSAITVLLAVFVCSSAVGQHYTFRFVTSGGRPQELKKLVFSPDSQRVAVATATGVTVADVPSGDVAQSIDFPAHSVVFTTDSDRLLMVSTSATRRLDVRTGQLEKARWQRAKGALGISLGQTAGKLVITAIVPGSAAADSGELSVGDEIVAFGGLGTRTSLLGKSPNKAVEMLAGPAGSEVRLIVVKKGERFQSDVRLKRYSAQTNRPWSPRPAPQTMAITSGGYHVVLAADDTSVVSTAKCVEVRETGLSALSPDGKRLAVIASWWKRPRGAERFAVEVHSLVDQQREYRREYPGTEYRDAVFTPDGARVLFAAYDRVHVLDVDSKKFLRPIFLTWRPTPPEVLAKQKEKERATAGTDAGSMAGARMDDIAPLGQSPEQARRRVLSSMDASASGVLAVAHFTGEVALWSLETGKKLATVEPAGRYGAERVRFSPDEKWLAYYVGGVLHVHGMPEGPLAEKGI